MSYHPTLERGYAIYEWQRDNGRKSEPEKSKRGVYIKLLKIHVGHFRGRKER